MLIERSPTKLRTPVNLKRKDCFDSNYSFGILRNLFSESNKKPKFSYDDNRLLPVFLPSLNDENIIMHPDSNSMEECKKNSNVQAFTKAFPFDEDKFIEWMPKFRRQKYLNSSKSEKIFTKEDLRKMLEKVIKETREVSSIQCNAELQKNLQDRQETFTKIVANEESQSQHKIYHNSQFSDFMF